MKSIQYGHWPSDTTVDLGPFRKRYTELSIVDGCVLWGTRVVIPSIFRQSLLQELHTSHLGMSRMKSLARSWPRLDAQIEEVCHNCVECSSTARTHQKLLPTHGWSPNTHGNDFMLIMLILVNTFCWWLLMHIQSGQRFTLYLQHQHNQQLINLDTCHGLPTTIVSDTSSPFQSAEFQHFVSANEILHCRVSQLLHF